MGIKLEKLLERCVEGIALFEVSYKYAPIYAKNHFARAKDEFVIYCIDSEKNKGMKLVVLMLMVVVIAAGLSACSG